MTQENIMFKHWKIIIPILILLAIALGLFQHCKNKYLAGKKYSFSNNAGQDLQKELRRYYQTARQLAPQTQTQTSKVTFLAVGDIMLSRNVAAAIQNGGDIWVPYKKMDSILSSTDFNFANLESPLVNNKQAVIGGHSLVFGASSDNSIGLADYNFKVLNLANNHSFDQGLAGINFTQSTLDKLGIAHEGTGNSLDETWQPAAVSAKGIKICFVGASYASVNDGGQSQNNYVARMEDLPRLKSAITTARSECDFVVATMHGGVEYTRTPNGLQTKFARAAIDDGADVVIGTHPHWVQTIKKYQHKYIFYSLGNFIFDQMWSQETKEGLTLKIMISKSSGQNLTTPGAAAADDLQDARQSAKLDSIELIPVVIENYSTPRPATAEETKKILDKIGQPENILYP